MKQEGSILGGSLMVAGTCIGAGALALPVQTGGAGFFPSVSLFFLCWAFTALTAYLFAELSLSMDKDVNIVTMAHKTLGRAGRVVAWILYIYLFYSLTVAYIAGSGDVITDLVDEAIPRGLSIVLFTAIFAPLVFFGARVVDRVNLVLVAGLGLAYVAFLGLGYIHVRPSFLLRAHWGELRTSLLIVMATFGYQGFIPTLTSYMGRNPRKVRLAILLGSLLPLLAYILWEALVLGIVPAIGLQEAARLGMTGVQPLRYALQSQAVFLIAEFFAFFALTSSFLGVTLAMRDFLADGLKVEKDVKGRLWLCLVIFGPALIIALTDPRFFLLALRYGAGVGVALLLGLLPVLMVWRARYRLKLPSPYRLTGGRPLLVAMGLFVLCWLAVEFYALSGSV